jgi:hypothetical protein
MQSDSKYRWKSPDRLAKHEREQVADENITPLLVATTSAIRRMNLSIGDSFRIKTGAEARSDSRRRGR